MSSTWVNVYRISPKFRILRLTFFTFHRKGFKILNKTDNNSFSNLLSVYLKTIVQLNLNLLIFCWPIASFKEFRILEILNFHPWIHANSNVSMEK